MKLSFLQQLLMPCEKGSILLISNDLCILDSTTITTDNLYYYHAKQANSNLCQIDGVDMMEKTVTLADLQAGKISFAGIIFNVAEMEFKSWNWDNILPLLYQSLNPAGQICIFIYNPRLIPFLFETKDLSYTALPASLWQLLRCLCSLKSAVHIVLAQKLRYAGLEKIQTFMFALQGNEILSLDYPAPLRFRLSRQKRYSRKARILYSIVDTSFGFRFLSNAAPMFALTATRESK